MQQFSVVQWSILSKVLIRNVSLQKLQTSSSNISNGYILIHFTILSNDYNSTGNPVYYDLVGYIM